MTYRARDGREETFEGYFNRYNMFYRGHTLPGGKTAETVYLSLNDPYYALMNGARRRPLDYRYLRSLTPAAQRFYEIVSTKIFAAIKNGYRKRLDSVLRLLSARRAAATGDAAPNADPDGGCPSPAPRLRVPGRCLVATGAGRGRCTRLDDSLHPGTEGPCGVPGVQRPAPHPAASRPDSDRDLRASKVRDGAPYGQASRDTPGRAFAGHIARSPLLRKAELEPRPSTSPIPSFAGLRRSSIAARAITTSRSPRSTSPQRSGRTVVPASLTTSAGFSKGDSSNAPAPLARRRTVVDGLPNNALVSTLDGIGTTSGAARERPTGSPTCRRRSASTSSRNGTPGSPRTSGPTSSSAPGPASASASGPSRGSWSGTAVKASRRSRSGAGSTTLKPPGLPGPTRPYSNPYSPSTVGSAVRESATAAATSANLCRTLRGATPLLFLGPN